MANRDWADDAKTTAIAVLQQWQKDDADLSFEECVQVLVIAITNERDEAEIRVRAAKAEGRAEGLEAAADWCHEKFVERKRLGMPSVIPAAAKSRGHYAERMAGGNSMLFYIEEQLRARALTPPTIDAGEG